MKTFFLLYLSLCLSAFNVKAQNPQAYSAEISNLHVQSIVQDSIGYIWMATARGLNRIDAYRKPAFYFKTSAETSLYNDNIYKLHVGRGGELIAMTRWGVNVYDGRTNSFKRIEDTNLYMSYTCAEEGHDGKIWLGLAQPKQLSYIDSARQRCHNIGVAELSESVSAICCDDRGMLWLTLDRGQGVAVFNPATRTIQYRNKQLAGVLRTHRRDRLYALTTDGRFVLMNSITRQIEKVILQTAQNIELMNVTADGRLYFLTHDMNLYLYDLQTQRFDIREIKGVDNIYNITSLLVDKQSNIWIGTFEEGYLFVPVEKHTFDIDYSLARHFRNEFVTYLTSDGKDRIWIATRHNGLHEYNRRTDTDKIILNLHLTSEEAAIACCLHDSQQRLWVATINALYCYDTRQGTRLMATYPKIRKSRYVTEDRQGNIWVICEGYGAVWMLANGRQEGFVRPFAKTLSYDASITYLTQLRSGQYMLAAYNDNVYRAELDGRLTPMPQSSPEMASFLHSVIYIYEDSDGILWLGTYGSGLMRYDSRRNRVKIYTMADGLPSNDILSITEDRQSRTIWLSTSYGLAKLQNNTFTNYFTQNGLLGNQYHERSLFVRNGILYFTGNHGITSFSPRKVNIRHEAIPLIIESLTTDKNTYYTAQPTKTIKLGYRENSFSISFQGFDYTSANSLRYSYRLEGYDKEWSLPSSTHTIRYTDLPPGRYTLKVKVANNTDRWSEQVKSLEIVIKPAPWKTWWAVLLYIIVGAYLTYRAIRFYIRYQVDQEKIKLSDITLAKERELNQAKINFFENVSHELRTPLGLIYGPYCELVKQDKFNPKHNEYLALMGDNIERLITLVEQLLKFSHLDSEVLSLAVVRTDVVAVIRKIVERFKSFNREKHIRTSIQTTQDAIYMLIDEDKIDKILSNLLSNAFKYTTSEGRIDVSISTLTAKQVKERFGTKTVLDTDYAVVAVKDSGLGIDESELEKIFTRFYRSKTQENLSIGGSGIGLYYTKRLVEKHKGLIKAERNSNVGTTFSFCLPLDESVYAPEELGRFEAVEVGSVANPETAEITETEPALPARKQPTEEQPEATDKPLLLIVEDEPNLQQFLDHLLSPYYTIRKAFDGNEGLEKARALIPDIIIMDVMMPVMNGYVLCNTLKNDMQTCHIPVVMLTAKSDIAEKIEGVKAGADIYLSKPFNPDYLASILQNILQNRKRMQHLLAEMPQTAAEPNENTDLQISQLDRKMLTRLDEKIRQQLSDSELSVDELASELNLSRSTFYRKIKGLTGYSPNEYVRLYRIKQATQLIHSDRYTLAEIADITGFGTQSYFSSIFKKHLGMTPSEYRQSYKEKSRPDPE